MPRFLTTRVIKNGLYGLLYKIDKSVEIPVDEKLDILELISLILDPIKKLVLGIFIEYPTEIAISLALKLPVSFPNSSAPIKEP